jgi:hypothetical protein
VISGPLEYLLKRYRTRKSGQETESGREIALEQKRPDEATHP